MAVLMVTCCIHYTIDPYQLRAFEEYAQRWPPIVERCGGHLVGYFMAKQGTDNFALALLDFESPAACEGFRKQLRADPEAQQNLARAEQTGCILSEHCFFVHRLTPAS
jgi:hypothetical protein